MTGRLPVKQACHPGIENWIPAFAGMTKKRTGSGREKKIMAVGRALRISVRIEAEIVRNEVRCEAVIENLSDEGMMVTTFPNNAIDLSCGSKFDMEFKIPSGGRVALHCMIMRAEKDITNPSSYILGLKILEQPAEYEEFFKSLCIKEMGVL